MREIKMMLILLRASAKSQVMYRMDFFIGVIGTFFYNGTFLASIGIITSRFQSIGGWSMAEMLFLYSLFMLGHSIYGFFFMNMTMLNRAVMEGWLDCFFLRPYGILTQMNGMKLYYAAFVDTMLGVAGMAVSYALLNLSWSPLQFGLLLVFAVSGAMIEYALALIMNCVTFMLPNVRSMFGAYYQLVLLAQRYPLNIFAPGLQAIMTFIFPLGFMNYYPSLLLLGKAHGWIGYFTPMVALVFVYIAHRIFGLTLRHYTSTGS